MKYLKTYKIFESKSLKFVKQPTKKGAKTETYNVVKDGEVIGQIKWSSRMRGYAFLPEKQHDDEIKNFIKDLMSKRKNSKLNEEFDFFSQYEYREECDVIINDIKDMLLELDDVELHTTVGYTPMTLTYQEKTPKMMVEVQGELGLCESNEDDINSTFERIKDYVKSFGYVTEFGSWEREYRNNMGLKTNKTYQMLIQK